MHVILLIYSIISLSSQCLEIFSRECEEVKVLTYRIILIRLRLASVGETILMCWTRQSSTCWDKQK